jgi:hypothetical protein
MTVRFRLSYPSQYTDAQGNGKTYWVNLPVSVFRNSDGSLTIRAEHDFTLKQGERYVLFANEVKAEAPVAPAKKQPARRAPAPAPVLEDDDSPF